MERRDNYAIAAYEARQLFMGYDHEKLAQKLKTRLDEDYLYTAMFREPYRIHRRTGDISRSADGCWVDANSFGESLTLLDLVCDSDENRWIANRWKNMKDFGLQFHSGMLESRNADAEYFQEHSEAFEKACLAFGGEKFRLGDAAYAFEIFEGLKVLIQVWFGEEEFPAKINWLWDENAQMYLRYETMHYAVGLLLYKLKEKMSEEM